MDLNFCPICEKHIEDAPSLSDNEDIDLDNLPPSVSAGRASQAVPAAPHPNKLQKAKTGTLRAKANGGVKRNQSSGRLAVRGLVSKAAAASVKQEDTSKEQEPARQPWLGYYCSAQCMEDDELRSRLALSDLAPASVPYPAHRTTRRLSSNSSYGYSSADEPIPSPTLLSSKRNPSGDRLQDYFAGPSSFRRNGKPSSLALASHHTRTGSVDRGSSDSLNSRGSPDYTQYHYTPSSTRPTTRSGLRAMTPIHSTFSQSELAAGSMARSESVDSQTRHSSSDEDSRSRRYSSDSPRPFVEKEAVRPDLKHQKSGSFSAIRRGIMPTRSAATPVLSQGVEGNAYGTVFSRSLTSADSYERPRNRRNNSSSASIPHLSCSPSSPASSTWSTRSTQSTASSTAPSDGYPAKSEHFTARHRTHSSLSVPHNGLGQRTPSLTAVPSYFSRSPPGRSAIKFPSSSFSESQGTISRIIHEKAAAKYNPYPAASPPASSSSTLHPTFAEDALAYPHITASSPGEATPTQSDGHLKRIGSNASVASLPHYFGTVASDTLPRRGSYVNLEPGPLAQSDSSPSSAHKGWNWDPSMPQYTAMRSKKSSDAERKRLFFFDQKNDE